MSVAMNEGGASPAISAWARARWTEGWWKKGEEERGVEVNGTAGEDVDAARGRGLTGGEPPGWDGGTVDAESGAADERAAATAAMAARTAASQASWARWAMGVKM